MKKLFFYLIAAALLVPSTIIASFLLGDIGPIKDRPLLEGAAATQENPVEALKALDAKTREELKARELAAYQAEPLDRKALQSLVVLEDIGGERAKSENIALALAELGRRNPVAQLAAIQIELTKKDYAQAYDRIDGLLRARPELSKQLFPVLVSNLRDDVARASLGKILAREPVWRRVFLEEMTAGDQTVQLVYRILSDLRKAKGTVSDYEKRTLIHRLFNLKQHDQAYFVWLDFLAPNELLQVKNVFDGSFSSPARNMFFDWNMFGRKTATFKLANRGGKAGDGYVKLDFFSDKEGGAYVYQILRLAPSDYVMSYDVLVEELKNPTGLVWRINCYQTGEPLGEGKPILEKGPWETRQMTFSVPAENCASQYLRVENKSTAALDLEISGKLGFDNVVIDDKRDAAAKAEKAKEDQGTEEIQQ
jgi:hypothetical protein